MSIEAAITHLLESDGGVARYVGSGDAARIYPVVVARGADHPALTYQQLSAQRGRDSDGLNGDVTGAWQIIVWAETYAALRPIADAVRLALDGIEGQFAGTEITQCLIAGESDTAAVDKENEELVFFGKQINFEIWWLDD